MSDRSIEHPDDIGGCVPQAGAVVMRTARGGPEVLLVTPRQDRTQWIFPKGHVESGESAREAAVREAREEAGVIAAPLAQLRALFFRSGDESVRVQYYLLAFQRAEQPVEDRGVRWCGLDDARRLLSFDDSRSILDEAAHAFAAR